MARLRVYIAVSLDGFVATADGGVDWLEPYTAVDYGYERFLAGIATIVMGRVTYAHLRPLGRWPYTGKRVLVWSHDPPAVGLPRGAAWCDTAPAQLAAELRDVRGGDVWVLGGPETIASIAAAPGGRIDEWEVFVMPVLLGDGLPLFAPGASVRGALTLVDWTRYANGAVRLVYRPARPASEPGAPAPPSPDEPPGG